MPQSLIKRLGGYALHFKALLPRGRASHQLDFASPHAGDLSQKFNRRLVRAPIYRRRLQGDLPLVAEATYHAIARGAGLYSQADARHQRRPLIVQSSPGPGLECAIIVGAMLRIVFLLVLVAPVLTAEPVRVLIAYYSQTGHTKAMAEAAAEGVRSVDDAEVVLRNIGEVTQEELEQADALMLGSPVHMGDVAVEVRRALVDWSGNYGFWSSRGLQNKVGAVFATGGLPSNGKEFTMLSMAQTMLQFGMVLVSPYGSVGASATTARPESDQGVNDHETEVARNLGVRVTEMARQMKYGATPKKANQ